MSLPFHTRVLASSSRPASAVFSALAGLLTLTAAPCLADEAKPLPPLPDEEFADDEVPSRLPEAPCEEPSKASTPAETQPTGHQDCALAVLQLLSDTELCLNGCRDAASVQAALPRFRELSERAHRLAEVQRHLPEPTSQDLISMNQHMERFNLLWGAIGDHIHRLEKDGLMSPELRSVLCIAPPSTPAPAQPEASVEPAAPAASQGAAEAAASDASAAPAVPEAPAESPEAPKAPAAPAAPTPDESAASEAQPAAAAASDGGAPSAEAPAAPAAPAS